MQAGLIALELERFLTLACRFFEPILLHERLRQYLMHARRVWIGLVHPLVGLFRDEDVSTAAVVKDVNIIRCERSRLVKACAGAIGITGTELGDAQPHPGLGIL